MTALAKQHLSLTINRHYFHTVNVLFDNKRRLMAVLNKMLPLFDTALCKLMGEFWHPRFIFRGISRPNHGLCPSPVNAGLAPSLLSN